jgi:Tfp pilus assembly protein PilF
VTVIDVIGGDAPFAAAREFIAAVNPADSRILHVLRFATHSDPPPDRAAHDDLTPLRGQLRFRSADRCLTELRVLGWYVRDAWPEGLTVRHRGTLNDADVAFFHAVLGHAGGALRMIYTGSAAHAADDAESARQRADRTWITAGLTAKDEFEWPELRRRCARYLTCGDSWTARWLLDEVLLHRRTPPPSVAHLTGLVYQMQGDSGAAELHYRLAAEGTGEPARSACDSIAMLYVRHHPPALRDLALAERMLAINLDAGTGPTEFALRHNALAVVRMSAGRHREALADMHAALDLLGTDPEHADARAMLLNNLGRLCLAAGAPADAERALREATELAPNLPDYWLDLAHHLAWHDQPEAALEAARRADELTAAVAEIPALIGFLLANAGAPAEAAEAYLRAASQAADPTDWLLDAARQFREADDYPAAAHALWRVPPLPPEDTRAADFALLDAAVTGNLNGWQPATMLAALESLAQRFPASPVVAANLAAGRTRT